MSLEGHSFNISSLNMITIDILLFWHEFNFIIFFYFYIPTKISPPSFPLSNSLLSPLFPLPIHSYSSLFSSEKGGLHMDACQTYSIK